MEKDPNATSQNIIKLKVKQAVNAQQSGKSTYRGFDSIDQEMEILIALQWFSKSRGGFLNAHTVKGHL